MKLLAVVLALFTYFSGGEVYTLKVNVTGLKPLKGDLYVSLHQRPEFFLMADSAFMKMQVKVQSEDMSIFFKDLPAGQYAIAVYHDENLNGVMDANEKGFPKEGYGFSTKNKMLGRAKFEQAAFEVTGSKAIEVKMIYPPGSAANNNGTL